METVTKRHNHSSTSRILQRGNTLFKLATQTYSSRSHAWHSKLSRVSNTEDLWDNMRDGDAFEQLSGDTGDFARLKDLAIGGLGTEANGCMQLPFQSIALTSLPTSRPLRPNDVPSRFDSSS